jgi:AraC-like DNA-binding protein
VSRIFDFITGAGIAQGIFLSVILLMGYRGKIPGNRVLAFLLVALSLSIAHPFFGPYLGPASAKDFLIDPTQSLLNPLIWLFVSSRARSRRIRPLDALHFLPFVAVCAFLNFMPSLLPAARFARAASIAYWGLVLAQAGAYFSLCVGAITRFSLALKENYSRIDAFRLEALHGFMGVILLLVVGRVLGLIIIAHTESAKIADRMMGLFQAFAAYALGAFMVFRKEPDPLGIPGSARGKYGKSPLSREKSEAVLAKADEFMRASRPYLDPELSLPVLAASLCVPRNELSRAINETGGSSFYDYVNRFRIEEFKRLAAETSKRSWKILSLALEAGFNSKPAFNAAFKRLEGTTPSSWISKLPKA